MKEIKKLLEEHGQQHLIPVLESLSESERDSLISQIKSLDWNTVELWKNPEDLSGKGRVQPIEGLSLKDIEARRDEFAQIGVNAIQEGKVGAVLLAGGQGTRLGSDAPKGAYDIGLTRPLYSFSLQNS